MGFEEARKVDGRATNVGVVDSRANNKLMAYLLDLITGNSCA